MISLHTHSSIALYLCRILFFLLPLSLDLGLEFGQVSFTNKLYAFTLCLINRLLGNPDAEQFIAFDIDEVVSFIMSSD